MNIEHSKFETIQYLICYPDGYNAGNKYPVLVFLHGAGTRGTEIEKLKNNAFFKHYERQQDHPFIVVAPLCHENTWFDLFESLKHFICFINEQEYTDQSRVYLMGASMGGYATWQLAMSVPELFAAIVPICGGGMYWNAARLKNVPVWAFHGAKDGTVLLRESEILVEKINEKGGKARLTVYPENGHNAWDDTYSNPAIYEWLLSHYNCNEEKPDDAYTDSVMFG